MSEVGDQRSEVRGRRSEIRGQRSEVGDQRSEVGGQRLEVGDQRSEVGGRRSEVGGQRSEIRGRRSEIRVRRSEVRGRSSELGGQRLCCYRYRYRDQAEGAADLQTNAAGWESRLENVRFQFRSDAGNDPELSPPLCKRFMRLHCGCSLPPHSER